MSHHCWKVNYSVLFSSDLCPSDKLINFILKFNMHLLHISVLQALVKLSVKMKAMQENFSEF